MLLIKIFEQTYPTQNFKQGNVKQLKQLKLWQSKIYYFGYNKTQSYNFIKYIFNWKVIFQLLNIQMQTRLNNDACNA